MSRRAEIQLSEGDVSRLLDEERVAIVSSLGPRGWPHSMPMWFVAREGEVWVWTYAKSQKVRNLERDPRATVLIETGHEYGELRGIMVEAEAEIHRDLETVVGFAEELTVRYAEGISSVDGDARAGLEAQAPKRVAIHSGQSGPRPGTTASWAAPTNPMRTTKTIALALVVGLFALISSSAASPSDAAGVPREFFGIAPQTNPTLDDVEHMQAGRIGSMRWPLVWETVQPTAKSEYDWTGYDEIVEMAARGHMRVLPFFYGTPSWLSHRYTVLPIDSARKRSGWTEFVEAAVERYGPHGEFWSEHGPGSKEPLPRIPVRDWQVWNEANFFYFATPASPQRYAKLLKLTSAAIKGVEPSAKVILSGLFGDPTAQPPNGLPAVQFLKQLYRVPGIKSEFDAVALHPYADEATRLEELVEEVRGVVLENHDPGAGLYVTEMGWGSQNDPNTVSFERGVRGQVTELRLAYEFLIENRQRLNIKGTYWFSWKDLPDVCNFCDSVGFFYDSKHLRAKPAWHAFVDLTGGRARP